MDGQRVIVVGGGLAGLAATCELLERGCNVTLLEKEENLGGNSSKATTGIAAPGMGMAGGQRDTGDDLIVNEGPEAKVLVQNGPKDLQWLARLAGVSDELVVRFTPGHKVARTVGTKTHFPGAVITYAVIHLLQQVANNKPERLEIRTNARVLKLLQVGNQVTGVQFQQGASAESRNGLVLIATGGFSGDLSQSSLLAKYAPAFLRFPTTNDERANGDGIKMGLSVGAGASNLDKIQLTPIAAVIPGQGDSQFKIVLSDAICGVGGKLVDSFGRRFCNEQGSAQERVDAMSKAKGPFRLIITEDQAAQVEWLVNFYAQRMVMQTVQNTKALCTLMGVQTLDPSIPANTKLYVAIVTPAIYTCGGGLNVSWQPGQAGTVLNAKGEPITGLYAAGEASAAPFQRLWSVSGIPMLHAIHTGRAAGFAAAAALSGGQTKGATDIRDLFLSSMTAPSKVADEPTKDEKPLDQMTVEELIAKVKDLESRPAAAPAAPAAGGGDGGITLDEVKKHNTRADAWIVVNGSVVNVTKWIPLHPGAEAPIEAYMGQDCSDEWNAIHRPGLLEKYLVAKGGDGPWLEGKLGSKSGGGGGAVASGGDGGLTMAEVAQHNTEQDCWVVVNGRAYDVTKWTQVHPGGVQAITAYAGKDASDEWNCIHKPGTIEKNLFPANPNGAVDKGPVSGASAAVAAPVAAADDEAPPPEGNGGIGGPIGALYFTIKNLVLMVLRTVFFTGNFKIDNNRKGTIRSACFLLAFTIIHVMGNFVGMLKGPNEANGEGYFFDRLAWTGGFGLWKEGPAGMSVVELYLAFALVLHVLVALKRSWEISMNYCIGTGRWNMLFSGLTILTFLTKHLYDLRFSPYMTYTILRAPIGYVAWSGLMEGRVFFETDESFPKVRVRDLYTREVELFKDLPTALMYSVCIVIFWVHMVLGWKKLVPADAMQIPKAHVNMVTLLGQIAATAVVVMYLSVVWYTFYAPAVHVHHVE